MISLQNHLLESCFDKINWKLGMTIWNYILEKNLPMDNITFGTIVKFYQHKKDLIGAFNLLKLMQEKNIKPNIIYFTNLIHVSFSSKNHSKAIEAFELCERSGLKKDSCMYSKLIKGLYINRQFRLVRKYLLQAIDEECGLKEETIEHIRNSNRPEKFHDLLEKVAKFKQVRT